MRNSEIEKHKDSTAYLNLQEKKAGLLKTDQKKLSNLKNTKKEESSRMKEPQRVTIKQNNICAKGDPEGENREKGPKYI